jgi:hypothetical protein
MRADLLLRRRGASCTRAIAFVLAGAILLSGCAVGKSSPATDVSATAATLRGTVSSDRDEQVTWSFSYGTTTAYGSTTPRTTLAIADRNEHPVAQVVTGLEPETTYHFRLCAQSLGSTSCGADQSFTTSRADPTVLSITATPDLYPQFDPQVSDYVTRCGGNPVTVDVAAPPGTEVAVDGQTGRSGRFSQTVALASGQRFAFSTVAAGQTRTFHVRCLPSDFPTWTFSRSAQPSQAWTLLALTGQRYVTFFDGDGVPVWWYQSDKGPIDARVLSNDTVAFARSCACGFGTPDTSYQIRRLDGTLVRTLRTAGVDTDHHDLQEVGNGNLLLAAYVPRDNVDLTAFGGPSSATVQDAVIQELAPDDSVVWSWNSKDHIALGETDPWWDFLNEVSIPLPDGRRAYDVVHFNAVEPTATGCWCPCATRTRSTASAAATVGSSGSSAGRRRPRA